ncbi:hypothetical protein EST38_g14059 [Candolleomyces aberdarensis]|uniref:Uncharacterized protein n=1 Tax=Candolleomyces aberdarensis TaxID=2316362 RepID=A0A4Q2D043_9AGAR|nr:hypothetical protein EST38_g14059 [Candolleomyces aberdarensis]
MGNQGGRGGKKGKGLPAVRYQEANDAAVDAVKKNAKAEETVKKYASYIKQAKRWLADMVENEKKKAEAFSSRQVSSPVPDNSISDESPDLEDHEPSTMDPEFAACLDSFPNACTPVAIAMFIWEKCFHEGCKNGVADMVYSAFLDHYNRLETKHGQIYRGDWTYDSSTDSYRGNPASAGRVKDMLKAVKKHHAKASPGRHHSRAMSYKDMNTVHTYIQANHPCPYSCKQNLESLAKRGKFLYYSALSSLSFVIWTRNGESRLLQRRHLNLDADPKQCSNGQVHDRIIVNLRFRKNWENKLESGELGLEGHVYNIYRQESKPAIDVYHHLCAWIDFYEMYLLGGEKLHEDDYIFPDINFKNLTVNTDTTSTWQSVDKLVKEMAHAAGLYRWEEYSTHCFRRGGAQYRFMFAPIGERWTMDRIRWWGGWAEGEKGDTLIRYLLDELKTYEQDHSDALCPVDESANKSHMGEDRHLRALTAADGLAISQQCNQVIKDEFAALSGTVVEYLKQVPKYIAAALPQCYNSQTLATSMQSVGEPIQPLAPVRQVYPPAVPWPCLPPTHATTHPCQHRPRPIRFQPIQAPSLQVPTHQPFNGWRPEFMPTEDPEPSAVSAPSIVEGPRRCVPKIPRSAGAKAWRIIVTDWEVPQPRRCPVALKDWPPEWYRKTQAVAYGIREMIATEYIDRFKRCDAAFLEAYPEHLKGMSDLHKAIRKARQRDGLAKERQKKQRRDEIPMDIDSEPEDFNETGFVPAVL